jgi:acyl carrier protein
MTMEQAHELFTQSVQGLATAGLLPADLARFAITPDMRMADLPIDSAGRMSLVVEVETRGSLSLPLDEIVEVETVNDFARLMTRSPRTGGAAG